MKSVGSHAAAISLRALVAVLFATACLHTVRCEAQANTAMDLEIDARDTRHRIITIHESLDVAGVGPDLVLQYPKWLPGDHAPSGTVNRVAGLTIRVDGVPVAWKRDPADGFAFHVPVTGASKRLDLQFEYLASSAEPGGAVMTRGIVAIKWPLLLLYPKGPALTAIQVRPRLLLPEGWKWASALRAREPATTPAVELLPVDLDVLFDSPAYAAESMQTIDLSAPSGPTVSMDIFAARGAPITPTPGQVEQLRALVFQTQRLFGRSPFANYHFLVTLNAAFGETGLEHLSSCEVALNPGHFGSWDDTWDSRYLIAHELVHAWNGKARTPQGLLSADLNSPLRTDLLWVYEGLTQYWAKVLTVRSGLWSRSQGLQDFAINIAQEQRRPTRTWRPLGDSTFDPIINPQEELTWRSRSGFQDYYDVGALLWLDVDTLIRRHSNGQRSLDDFAKNFFSAASPRGYNREDVEQALRRLADVDWHTLLERHLDDAAAFDWQRSLQAAGYRLVFNDTPAHTCPAPDERRNLHCYTTSIGLTVTSDGTVESVEWGDPAFEAGLGPRMKLLAVNHAVFSTGQLEESIRATSDRTGSIILTVEDEGRIEDVSIPYQGGMRYPHLVPLAGAHPLLDTILSAR